MSFSFYFHIFSLSFKSQYFRQGTQHRAVYKLVSKILYRFLTPSALEGFSCQICSLKEKRPPCKKAERVTHKKAAYPSRRGYTAQILLYLSALSRLENGGEKNSPIFFHPILRCSPRPYGEWASTLFRRTWPQPERP